MYETLGGLYIGIILFLVILAILWFCLPFAIFGTKDKLNQLIRETQKSNEELRRIRDLLSRSSSPQSPSHNDQM